MHLKNLTPRLHSVSWIRGLAIMLLSMTTAIAAHAQNTRGSITGHIDNIATNVSVKSAEVIIKGTQFVAYTDQGGDYVFTDIPAGEVTVVVTYTGLLRQEKRVTVSAGGRATADFNMVPQDAPKTDQVVNLEKFVVSAEREGNARAYEEQRRNIGITQVVATDAFGNVTTGNVAEFLKFLPGVTVGNDESEIRSIGLGGMDPQYTGVTIDGARLASSGAGTDATARTFQFQQISSDAIESIEVDLLGGGDSPGGTVKLRTKGAFDQKGRKLNYDIFMMANSNYLGLGRTPGGGDEYTRKTKPGFRLSYSEAFLRNTIGFSLGLSRIGYYNLNDYMAPGYGNLNPSMDGTNDPQSGDTEIPPYIGSITFKDANRVEQKDSVFAKIDYKLSPFGKLALSMNYANVEQEFFNRSIRFGGGTVTRSTLTHVEGGSGLQTTDLSQGSNKTSETLSGNLKFDYKFGRFEYDALVGFSKATTIYQVANDKAPYVYGAATTMSPGTGWVADRASPQSTNWIFTRTGTNDWTDPNNWTIGNITTRNTDAETNVAEFSSNLKWRAPTRIPLSFTLSLEGTMSKRHIMPDNYPETYTYNPPVAGQGITGLVSPYTANTRLGGNLGSLKIPYLDKFALYRVYADELASLQPGEKPTLFTLTEGTSNNALKRRLQGYNDLKETLAAATFEVSTKLFKRLDIQGKLRYDYTDQEAEVLLVRTTAEMEGPKHNFQSSDRNTPEYIKIQFRNGERTTTTNTYSELMPSVAVKYAITPSLAARVGYSTSIGRVNVGYISGAWGFGTAATGEPLATAPNPGLTPDVFKKVLFALSYNLKSGGELSITCSDQAWTGSSTEAGYVIANEGPEDSWDQRLLATMRSMFGTEYINTLIDQGYLIRTLADYNKTDRKMQQVALGYNQRLPFLKSVTAFASFTNTMPDWLYARYATLRSAAGGIRYSGRYIDAGFRCTWQDRFRVGSVGAYNETMRKARFILDLDAQIKISKRFNIYTTIDNVTNAESTTYYSASPDYITRLDRYGAKITVGIKGSF